MKKIFSVFLSLVILISGICGLDFSANAQVSDTSKYYMYLKENYNISDFKSFVGGKTLSAKTVGVVSAYENDFDQDGVTELVFFMLEDSKLTMCLLVIEDSRVVEKDSVNFAYSMGNCYYSSEIFTMGYAIGVHNSFANYSASRQIEEFEKYTIVHNKFVLSKDYYCEEFARYDFFKYQERVSGTEYSSYKAFCKEINNSEFGNHSPLLGEGKYLDSDFRGKSEEELAENSDILNVRYEYGNYDYQNGVNYNFLYTIYDKTNLLKHIDYAYRTGMFVYASDTAMTVTTGRKIRVGVGLFENGIQNINVLDISIVIENNSVVTYVSSKVSDGFLYADFIGVSEGRTYIQFSDSYTGCVKRIPICVSNQRSNVYTFLNIPQEKIGNKNCNFYNFNGMYVYDFPTSLNNNTLEFDIYNTRMINGIVEVHDKDGKIKDAIVVKKRTNNNTGIWESVVDNSMILVEDLVTGDMFDWLNPSRVDSECTHIKINNFPEGGYLKITNDMDESNLIGIVNLVDTLLVLEDAVDSSFSFSVKDSKVFTDEITKEILASTALNELVNTVGIDGSKFSEKIGENLIETIEFNNESYSNFIDSCVNFLTQLNIEAIILKSAKSVGINVSEKVFESLSGIAGIALMGMFAFAKALNAIEQVLMFCKTTQSGFIQINSYSDKTVQSNGVTVKQESSFDKETALQVYSVKVTPEILDIISNFVTDDIKDDVLTKYTFCYDISLIKNKNTISPKGSVEVTVRLPKELIYFSSFMNVYHINDEGSVEKLEVIKCTKDTITFVTNHFSEFLFCPVIDDSCIDVSQLNISYNAQQYYHGKEVKINPVISYNGVILQENTDYLLYYDNNTFPGTANVTIVGINNYYGSLTKSFKIICNHERVISKLTKATLSKNGKIVNTCSYCNKIISTPTVFYPKSIKISSSAYIYNGKTKKPTVKVVGSNGKTISSSNYTVTYASGRKNVGKYAVKITFKGNYSGTKTLYFTIKPKATSISSLSAGSKKFTVKWKKQSTQVTGYQIQYSTSSKFKSPKQ